MKNIRNFCIIAHIDHGKSTLADRLLQQTNTVSDRELSEQTLDDMDIEKERGITIKSHAIQMDYEQEGEAYTLNLIDTPGHVDFSYEVSRSIAACEGALLIVDAAQGIQAQTISNLYLALENDLEIIPVLNKMDLPGAQPEEVKDQIVDLIGCEREKIIPASGKTGLGVTEILKAVVEDVPHPKGDPHAPLQAMIFDSVFNPFRGIIAYYRVLNGSVKKGAKVKFFNTGKSYNADEIGILRLDMESRKEVNTGDVGYIISGIKSAADVKVGDTLTDSDNPCESAVEGFEDVKPMVFAGVYPVVTDDYEDLRNAMEKLQLNDASLTFEPESSVALGFGFRCGFLGMLHLEIITERLEREFEMDVITTVPNVPPPKGDPHAPLQAMIFDSVFNPFRGIIAYYRVLNGSVKKGAKVKFFNTGKSYNADEIGILRLDMESRKEVNTGDVGYIISGIKSAADVKVGDTLTDSDNPCESAVEGFEDVKPMVFAGVYPVVTDDYEDLRNAMEKLQLNDASLTFEPESSVALGFGFRCGFLGMLHLEIITERLEREFEMDVITTVPNVSYITYTKRGDKLLVNNPSELPDPSAIDWIEEPYIKAQVITKSDYVGSVMTLAIEKRGELSNQVYLSSDRVELSFEMPLAEIVFDFYDRLKSVSKGYASFDYYPSGMRQSNLKKMDILLNGDNVDALSALIHADNAFTLGKKICKKLKELIPRQQFVIAIQAAIGAKIIARETISALRKDVTAKCYGGDISRKRKLLEKQKAGKKKMRQIGSVEIPQSAFLAVLKLDD